MVSIFMFDGMMLVVLEIFKLLCFYINDFVLVFDGNFYVIDFLCLVIFCVDKVLKLMVWFDFVGMFIKYGFGVNFNGIVVMFDGKYLFVVQFNMGELWCIDLKIKVVKKVMDGFVNGDGFLFDGCIFYVVCNKDQVVVKVSFSVDYGSG